MAFFSMPFGRPKKNKSKKSTSPVPGQEQAMRRPGFESLEDRTLLSANTISGYVFNDVNNNGIKDTGEVGIANNELELQNSQGQVIATTITDANGFYEFDRDETINQDPVTLEQTITIPSTLAGFSITKAIQQFDSSLGELLEVEIVNEGSITSEIRAENSSTMVGSTITGLVSGTISLTGPNFSLNSSVTENAGSFQATAYDGVIDFGGSSGRQFAPVTAQAQPRSIVLTGSQLQPFIGTGTVDVSEEVVVNSTATGGGNLLVGITSTAETTITVRYTYQPTDCLPPGDYTIVQKEQPPLQPGSSQRYFDGLESQGNTVIPNTVGTDSISVTLANSDSTHNNFGEVEPSSISGKVYYDANDNGIPETDTINGQPREPGIAGVAVTLTGTNDLGQSLLESATTHADGTYQFNNLRPGTYTVSEEQPADFQDGKDAVGTAGGTLGNDILSDIPLGSGMNATGYNFGEVKTSSLAGSVYHDADNDGNRDIGEAGIGGVTVVLTGTDNNGTVTRTTTTAADGSFSFENLRPGTYAITETQPQEYLDGKESLGTLGGVVASDRFTNIVLNGGEQGQDYNFGEIEGSSISGYVFHDANNNGIRDAGESGLFGVEVVLTGADDKGGVNRATVTDFDGFYHFEDLRPGNYTLQETQPLDYLDGKDSMGTPGGTLSNDRISNIALGQGIEGEQNNFGEIQAARLAGYVYEDANNNGVKDVGEGGIAGVSVRLTGTNDRGASVSQSTTTRQDGSYEFEDLRPGNYVLEETQPLNFLDGKDSVGTQGGTLNNDRFTNINLTQGTDGQDNNFGELRSTSLSGSVYHDANNNGRRDLGEQGISGVSIRLEEAFTGLVQETTTNGNGNYNFLNLPPGTYQLSEVQPPNYLDGEESLGTRGGMVGDDLFTGIVLTNGASGTNYDFGELLPGGLSGFVYHDQNDNGIRDASEVGIEGVLLTMTGTTNDGSSVFQQTTTGPDGTYSFEDLLPGIYDIEETQPVGYLDGKDSVGSQGGILTNDQISNINLQAGGSGVNYNFGERVGSSLSGFVYEDANDNGFMDTGIPGIGGGISPQEAGIAGVTVTLTGVNENGFVQMSTVTGIDGSYGFTDLLSGTYSISETQPAGYKDGKDTLGNIGGIVGDDSFTNIVLQQGADGIQYNFGERVIAEVGIEKVVDLAEVGGGDLVTYTLTVTNTGPSDAQDVQVIDTLPNGMTFVSADSPGWSQIPVGNELIFTRATLAANSSSTITITATAPLDSGTYENVAVVTTLTPDEDQTNNEDRATVTVPDGDVGIEKTASPDIVLAGGTVTFTLNVTNNGPSIARDVQVRDILPVGLEFLDATAAGWDIDTSNDEILFTRSTLDSGASSVITFRAIAPVDVAPGTFENLAVVTTSSPDSDPTNNEDIASFVVPPTEISVFVPSTNRHVCIGSSEIFFFM